MAAAPSLARAARVVPFPASAGAERARALYEQHGSSVYAFCLHRLADRQDAEDATQATFLNAFRSLERGVEPELESAWLLAIAKRVVLNRRRAASRRRRVETPDDLAGLGEVVAAPPQEADELIRLRESLSSLPEQQRSALILREWQGLTYHEIAAELGLSHAAVETLLFRARRMLASELTTPQRSKRRGLLKTLNLGPLVSAVKALFGTGGAKLAVVVALAVAGSSAHVGRPPVDKQAAAPAAPAPRPVHAPGMLIRDDVHRAPARLRQHTHAATSSEIAPSSGRESSVEPAPATPPAATPTPPVAAPRPAGPSAAAADLGSTPVPGAETPPTLEEPHGHMPPESGRAASNGRATVGAAFAGAPPGKSGANRSPQVASTPADVAPGNSGVNRSAQVASTPAADKAGQQGDAAAASPQDRGVVRAGDAAKTTPADSPTVDSSSKPATPQQALDNPGHAADAVDAAANETPAESAAPVAVTPPATAPASSPDASAVAHREVAPADPAPADPPALTTAVAAEPAPVAPQPVSASSPAASAPAAAAPAEPTPASTAHVAAEPAPVAAQPVSAPAAAASAPAAAAPAEPTHGSAAHVAAEPAPVAPQPVPAPAPAASAPVSAAPAASTTASSAAAAPAKGKGH